MARLPNPKFNLRLPTAKGKTLIYLVLRYNGNRLVYSTGYSISPKDWDFKTQRPIAQARRNDLFIIKRTLDDLSTYCLEVFTENQLNSLSIEDLKYSLDKKTGKVDDSRELENVPLAHRKLSFLKFLDIELEELANQASIRKSTLKSFTHHATNFKKFAKEVKTFDFDDVDWNFRLEYIDWLKKQNYQLGYGNKSLSLLRQFLERARRKKLHNNTDYQGTGWMVSPRKASGQRVILTNEELQVLARIKLSGFADKVRDLFLIGVATGQRFSDYSRYIPNNFYKTINNIPILSIISQKTDTTAKIPLNIFPWLTPILEKHKYHSPKMSMQKFNVTIKEICRKATFDDEVLVVEQYIGRKASIEKKYVPKYTQISSHTCRRTFATNLYRMGYRLAQIMPMTGHSTEAQLRQYIGIDSEQNAEEVAFSIMERRSRELDNTCNNLRVVNG